MGQKVHPKGFRFGVIEGWESRWFAEKDYSVLLHDDIRIRGFIKKRLHHAGIAKVEVERAANKAKVNIYTARPGIVIGKKRGGDRKAQGRTRPAHGSRSIPEHS